MKYLKVKWITLFIFLAMGTAFSVSDVQTLIGQLQNPDPKLRQDAANGLAEMGAQAASAAPALGKALKDADAYVRNAAANALSQIGPSAKMVLPEIMQAMHDSDPSVSQAAQTAIGVIGPDAYKAVPDLIGFIKAWPSSATESPAAFALIKIGEASVPGLAKLLEEPEKRVVLAALYCMGEIKSTSRTTLDALYYALQNPDPEISEKTAISLRKMGAPAVPILGKALANNDPFVRKQSAWALARIGKPAMPMLSKLRSMSRNDRNPEVRSAATWAVQKLEGKAPPEIEQE